MSELLAQATLAQAAAHLLCSNYWMQPIYQELLHSSSRYNAIKTGEKNRPSNDLARISAHPRPPKKLKPAASGTRFTDWSAKHPSKVPFTKAWRGLHLRKASKGLEGGLKGAWRGLEGLQGGLKGAWSLQRWKGLRGGLKGAWRGLQGGLKPSTLKGASRAPP